MTCRETSGHTILGGLPAVLNQVESVEGQSPTMGLCGRGYRVKRWVGETRIEIPESCKVSTTEHEKRQARARFRPERHRTNHRSPQERSQDAPKLP